MADEKTKSSEWDMRDEAVRACLGQMKLLGPMTALALASLVVDRVLDLILQDQIYSKDPCLVEAIRGASIALRGATPVSESRAMRRPED